MKNRSIALIGMAGVGKTSFGKRLAQETHLPFLDTDDCLENRIGTSLHTFISKHPADSFLKEEEAMLLSLVLEKPTILATGGSVIYSEKGMLHLKHQATLIWLKDAPQKIKSRIKNIKSRGLINPNKKPFEALYQEREYLYKKYADIIIEFPARFNAKFVLEKLKETL